MWGFIPRRCKSAVMVVMWKGRYIYSAYSRGQKDRINWCVFSMNNNLFNKL